MGFLDSGWTESSTPQSRLLNTSATSRHSTATVLGSRPRSVNVIRKSGSLVTPRQDPHSREPQHRRTEMSPPHQAQPSFARPDRSRIGLPGRTASALN